MGRPDVLQISQTQIEHNWTIQYEVANLKVFHETRWSFCIVIQYLHSLDNVYTSFTHRLHIVYISFTYRLHIVYISFTYRSIAYCLYIPCHVFAWRQSWKDWWVATVVGRAQRKLAQLALSMGASFSQSDVQGPVCPVQAPWPSRAWTCWREQSEKSVTLEAEIQGTGWVAFEIIWSFDSGWLSDHNGPIP